MLLQGTCFRAVLDWMGWAWLLGLLFWPIHAQTAETPRPNEPSAALPPGWADRLFEQKMYDFGRVPAKAHAQFDFSITNPYPFEVEITRIRSTCECTEPVLPKTTLAPGEQTQLTARLRTERFQGRKGATLTVTFIRPEFAEVQLHVTAYIDPTVSLDPPELDFGLLQPGQKLHQEAQIACRGRPDWRIESLHSPKPHISAKLTEIERTPEQVRYRLQVHLEAPGLFGPLKEVLFLQTNDPQNPTIPVLVTGRVASELEVHPPMVWLGGLWPGQKVSKLLVVRGQRPFRIQAATTTLPGLSIELPQPPQTQTLYQVILRYQAPKSSGKHKDIIRIQTDLAPQPMEIPVQVFVLSTEPHQQ